MAEIINARLKQQSDTLANYLADDKIFLLGEIIYVSDTNTMKFGNGVSTFSELPWATMTCKRVQNDSYILAEGEIGFDGYSNNFKVGLGNTEWSLLSYFYSEDDSTISYYDTAANLTADNPQLLHGVIGIESDTGKIKIGSGYLWNSTDYNYLSISTADKLATPVNITIDGGGYINGDSVSFDGSSDITLNISLNVDSLSLEDHVHDIVNHDTNTLSDVYGRNYWSNLAVADNLPTAYQDLDYYTDGSTLKRYIRINSLWYEFTLTGGSFTPPT